MVFRHLRWMSPTRNPMPRVLRRAEIDMTTYIPPSLAHWPRSRGKSENDNAPFKWMDNSNSFMSTKITLTKARNAIVQTAHATMGRRWQSRTPQPTAIPTPSTHPRNVLAPTW